MDNWMKYCGEMKFVLVETCYACPEQYDVYLYNKQVGYMRLRHHMFRCDFRRCGESELYCVNVKSDGRFDDDEREFYIEEALKEIAKKLGIDKFTYEIR